MAESRQICQPGHRQAAVQGQGLPGSDARGDRRDVPAAIFRFLAELSPDIYVKVMGQYRPEYEVGQLARDGSLKHAAINRTPDRREMHDAFAAAASPGCGASISAPTGSAWPSLTRQSNRGRSR